MMKKIALILFVPFILIVSTGCVKDSGCQEKTVQSEEGAILAYASANGITATKHSSGLYYQIINPGSGPTPSASSTLSVKYTGKRLDGTIFDQRTTPISFPLRDVIAGWQLGLPLIQKGGTIKLIIPSSLAYGCAGRNTIAPYTILYFDIELVDVL